MARSRRRMTSRRSGTRRPKGDWVYRAHAVNSSGTSDNLGSYVQTVPSLGTGPTNARAVVLYDSKYFMMQLVRIGAISGLGTGYQLPSAARAEGNRPLILRVQGTVYWLANTWSLGNRMSVGIRIIKTSQDIATGAALLDADYSMWADTAGARPADWANARALNLWERRFETQNNGDQPSIIYRSINVKLRTRLNPDEALYMYTEAEGGASSVSMLPQYWLRTFVVDEGSG